jgi:hypothetical protein
MSRLYYSFVALHVCREVIQRRLSELERDRLKPYSVAASNNSQDKLNEDLTAILKGRLPRQVGQLPRNMGGYQALCPNTPECAHVTQLLQANMAGPTTSTVRPLRRGGTSTSRSGAVV